jgi:hypothetical protein
MIAISLGGLLGAIACTIVAALVYGPVANAIERRMRARPRNAEDQPRLPQEIGLMRHGVITFDLLLCCGLGYWLGERIAG